MSTKHTAKIFVLFTTLILLTSNSLAVFAQANTFVFDSSEDFSNGVFLNTEGNVSPGELKLTRDGVSQEETSFEDFSKGYGTLDTLHPVQINTDGSLSLPEVSAYDYTALDSELVDTNTEYVSYVESLDIAYFSTYDGLYGVGGMGTVDPSDDTLVAKYTETTSLALPSSYEVLNVYYNETDELLYVGLDGGGVCVIDTNGTATDTDDSLLFTYNDTSSPSLANNYVRRIEYNDEHGLIYASIAGSGIQVIDFNGTSTNFADDTISFTYSTLSTPSIPTNYVYGTVYDDVTNVLYAITRGGGVRSIDTKGTTNPSDDTVITTYNLSSSPALISDYIYDVQVYGDYLFIGEEMLTVIDTKGTVTASDDTLLWRYGEGDNVTDILSVDSFLYDESNNLIYISSEDAVFIVNTQGTATQSDDTIEYRISSNYDSYPRLLDTYGVNAMDMGGSSDLIYYGQGGYGGLGVMLFGGEVNTTGTYFSKPQSTTSLPSEVIIMDSNINSGESCYSRI